MPRNESEPKKLSKGLNYKQIGTQLLKPIQVDNGYNRYVESTTDLDSTVEEFQKI